MASTCSPCFASSPRAGVASIRRSRRGSLTGRRLFAAANELDVLLMVRDAKLSRFDKYGADIEPGLAAIVRKALKKSVEERWSGSAAFRDALAEWLFEQRKRITPRQVAE